MIWAFIQKMLGSALVAGFKEWLNNLTAQQAGAAKQKNKDTEVREEEAKDVRNIKNNVRINNTLRSRVHEYFKRTKPPTD